MIVHHWNTGVRMSWRKGDDPLKQHQERIAELHSMQDSSESAVLRRRAGLALGEMGWVPADLDTFVEVPAGKFLYGGERKECAIPHRYWIGKYPVTNTQYGRFLADDGCNRQEFWSFEGWAWRNGAESDLSAIEDVDMKDAYRRWFAARPSDKRGVPLRWDDPELSNPISPVVGICLFEAQAYCRWLSRTFDGIPLDLEQTVTVPGSYVARLPTEEEWERAARGSDGREYPWGCGFETGLANAGVTGEPNGRGTTAVCAYPQCVSPVGAWDMAGNVWEWTLSCWSSRPGRRVVRGGAWSEAAQSARCAFRYWFIPDYFNYHVGFRVVVSPAEPDS